MLAITGYFEQLLARKYPDKGPSYEGMSKTSPVNVPKTGKAKFAHFLRPRLPPRFGEKLKKFKILYKVFVVML